MHGPAGSPGTHCHNLLYLLLALQASRQRLRVVVHLLHTGREVLVVPGVVIDLGSSGSRRQQSRRSCWCLLEASSTLC